MSENITVQQLAKCVLEAAEIFAPKVKKPHTWGIAQTTTRLTCSRLKMAYPTSTCLCGKPRRYGHPDRCGNATDSYISSGGEFDDTDTNH